jgi:UDPglucose 6-dehydrogenase
MKLTVIGTGYVGLVTGTCFADMGNDVLCVDVDAHKIAQLRRGEIPIYEPGLEEMVRRNVAAGRLHFDTDVKEAVRFGTMQFIAVGTPPDEDGSADMRHVLTAARTIGEYMTDYKLVIDKSTVPVGTADLVQSTIAQTLAKRGVIVPYDVVSNPEFLREGAAVEDFMRPDRIVVGADDDRARHLMQALYAPFQRQRDKLVMMDVRSAELTKYAANAMLATRISFMNEMALLADKLGADIEQVRRGIGSDPRIGPRFLYAGCGYGGSCFPKDVKALVKSAQDVGEPLHVLHAVERANERQKHVLVDRIVERFGDDLRGRRVALWGLAFKPDTDDLREAPSKTVIAELVARGAHVVAHDPQAMPAARRELAAMADHVDYVDDPMTTLEGADALIVVTEWRAFRSPNFEHMRSLMKTPLIVDGRNLYDPQTLARAGFEYRSIGRGACALQPESAAEESPESASIHALWARAA